MEIWGPGTPAVGEIVIQHNHVKVEITSPGFTSYVFRGPRSHRRIRIIVPKEDYALLREEKALYEADGGYLVEDPGYQTKADKVREVIGYLENLWKDKGEKDGKR